MKDAFESAIKGILETDDYYSYSSMCNRTNVEDGVTSVEERYWYVLIPGADLRKAVSLCVDYCNQVKKMTESGQYVNLWRPCIRIQNKAVLDEIGMDNYQLIEMCRNAGVYLICDICKGQFFDFTDGQKYREIITHYAGSADDAATYVEQWIERFD